MSQRVAVFLVALIVSPGTCGSVALADPGGAGLGEEKIQQMFGGTVDAGALTDGYVLTWDATTAKWNDGAVPAPAASSWADVLAAGASSGANDPTIATGQSLLGAAELTMDSTGTGAVSLGAGAAAKAVTIGSVDTTSSLLLQAGTGAFTQTAGGIWDVNAAGAVTIDGTTLDFTGSGLATITGLGVNLAGGATEIDVTTTGALDLNSAAGTWDSSATLDFEAATSGSFNVTTGALVLSTTTSGDLTLSTTTAGDILLSGAAEIDLNAATLLDMTAGANWVAGITGTADLDSSGAFSVNSAGAINIGTDAVAQILTIGEVSTRTEVQIDGLLVDVNAGATGATLDSAAGLSLDAATSSNFTVTGAGQDLNLRSVGAANSATLLASGVDANVGLLASGGGASQVAQVASAGTGASAVDINATAGGIDLDAAGAVTIDGVGASNFTIDSGNLTLATTTSGTLGLSGVALVDIDAGANLDIDVTGTYDMLASSAFSIDGTGASNLTATSGSLTVSTVTTGSLILDGVALVDINAGANLDVDITGTYDLLASSTFSIDGTGASNVTATSGDLTLATLTSGDLIGDSVAAINLDAGTTFDMLSAGAFSIDGTGASNVSSTSGTLTVSALTSGDLVLDSAAGSVTIAGSGGAGTFGGTLGVTGAVTGASYKTTNATSTVAADDWAAGNGTNETFFDASDGSTTSTKKTAGNDGKTILVLNAENASTTGGAGLGVNLALQAESTVEGVIRTQGSVKALWRDVTENLEYADLTLEATRNGSAVEMLRVGNSTTATGAARVEIPQGLLSTDSLDALTATALAIGGTTATGVDVSSTGEATTIKGTLNADEAVTFDTTLGVTGVTTASGGISLPADQTIAYGTGPKSVGELVTITGEAAEELFSIVTTGLTTGTGVRFFYSINCTDGTEYQSETGMVLVSITVDDGGVTASAAGVLSTVTESSGTLTPAVFSVTTTDDDSIEINIASVSSLTQTTHTASVMTTTPASVSVTWP